MKELRVSITDDGECAYISVQPEPSWGCTRQANDLITVDYDVDDNVMGIELIGSAARNMIRSLFTSVMYDGLSATPGGLILNAMAQLGVIGE